MNYCVELFTLLLTHIQWVLGNKWPMSCSGALEWIIISIPSLTEQSSACLTNIYTRMWSWQMHLLMTTYHADKGWSDTEQSNTISHTAEVFHSNTRVIISQSVLGDWAWFRWEWLVRIPETNLQQRLLLCLLLGGNKHKNMQADAWQNVSQDLSGESIQEPLVCVCAAVLLA